LTGNAYVTGKVIEDVATNLAVYITDQQNGWVHDVVTGQEAFTAEDWGIRNKWLWTPTSSTRILLTGNFAYTRGEACNQLRLRRQSTKGDNSPQGLSPQGLSPQGLACVD
jgi:hypothetical protein